MKVNHEETKNTKRFSAYFISFVHSRLISGGVVHAVMGDALKQ
jgi:hypothetical protein